MGNPKRYSKEFQERAVRRMKLGENMSQLGRIDIYGRLPMLDFRGVCGGASRPQVLRLHLAQRTRQTSLR
jgi:hypothetical protein